MHSMSHTEQCHEPNNVIPIDVTQGTISYTE